MSAANDYLKKLGAELTGALGPDFKFFRSRCELQRSFAGGHHSVVLGGSTKWSPFISVAFTFGVCFDEARKAEKALGYQPTHYQILYYSPNGPRKMGGLEYDGPGSWDVNITPPATDILDALRLGVIGMAIPFFQRFQDPTTARDALVANDPWCRGFGGQHAWRRVLALDAALGQLDRFHAWCQSLPDSDRKQALQDLSRLR